jgi:hypothetical protein
MCGTVAEKSYFNPEADIQILRQVIKIVPSLKVLQKTEQRSPRANSSSVHLEGSRSKRTRGTDCCILWFYSVPSEEC